MDNDIRTKRLARLAAIANQNSRKDEENARGESKESINSLQQTDKKVEQDEKSLPKNPPTMLMTNSKHTFSISPENSKSPEGGTQFSTSENESKDEILKKWINDEIQALFQSSFIADSSQFIFLPSIHEELASLNLGEYVSKFLHDNILDRIFIENLSDIGRENPLMFLFDVWNNSNSCFRSVNKKFALRKLNMTETEKSAFENQKEILEEISRLACSYGLLLFQIPDMFLNSDEEKMKKNFSNKIKDGNFIEYVLAVSEEAKAQECLLPLLNIWFVLLSNYLIVNRVIDMDDERYISVLNFYLTLLADRTIAGTFHEIDNFDGATIDFTPDFETKTLLGPILRVSPLDPQIVPKLYDRTTHSKYEIANIQKSIQQKHKNLLNTYLFPLIDKIIRGSESSRKALLKYFSRIINRNHLRVASMPKYKELSSHGFMANISLILIKLSLPFLKEDFKKLDRIDINYFSKEHFLDISDETRINASIKEANVYFEDNKSSECTNFISDCFYITIAYLHYGVGGISRAESKTNEIADHLANQIKLIEEQKAKMIANNRGQFTKMADVQLKMVRRQLTQVKADADSFQGFFFNDEFQSDIFSFYSLSCVFLTRLLDPSHQFPFAELQLPFVDDAVILSIDDDVEALRRYASSPFKYFPEYTIEAPVNYISYIIKYVNNPLKNNMARLIFFMEFAVSVLRCPELVSNPHLKSRLVECFFFGVLHPENDQYSPGFMLQPLISNKMMLDHLLYSLLEFYVSVEKTGASSQFYDKFNSRYYISTIIETLWDIEHYKEQLKLYSETQEGFFIRFVARMLNDTTYLLDESLRELAKIHHLSNEIQNRQENDNLELAINIEFEGKSFEELSKELSDSERLAKSFNGLSNKTIELFKLFTGSVPVAFCKLEIVDRLAAMLDYNLNQLVGPKYRDLKVKNPEEYKFNPRQLLTDICFIFLNLSKEHIFIEAVSRDARSFKKELFYKAESIISKFGKFTQQQRSELIKFAENAETARIEEEEADMELGDDIPDEFLDPLMYTLMKEPVILPSSKVSIDLSTIKAHLLSDSTDPFNRQPMKLEDVIPDVELKAKIEKFKNLKKKGSSDDVEMSG